MEGVGRRNSQRAELRGGQPCQAGHANRWLRRTPELSAERQMPLGRHDCRRVRKLGALGLVMRTSRVWKNQMSTHALKHKERSCKQSCNTNSQANEIEVESWMNQTKRNQVNESRWVRDEGNRKITTSITCIWQQSTQVEETQAISTDAACDLIADGHMRIARLSQMTTAISRSLIRNRTNWRKFITLLNTQQRNE